MSFLENINWRYATKKFDTSKKVSSADLEKILSAIRLTPTSYGLQPYHVYVISDADIKMRVQETSFNQEQFSTCSHLLIFAARTKLDDVKEEYLQLMSGGDPTRREGLNKFEDLLNWVIGQKEEQKSAGSWSAHQTYIALGFALAACAELRIDSCPMEGVNFDEIRKMIDIPQSQTPILALPIGYRVDGEGPRTPEKVRFSQESLFTTI